MWEACGWTEMAENWYDQDSPLVTYTALPLDEKDFHLCVHCICVLAFLYALCYRICSTIWCAFGGHPFKFKVMRDVKTSHKELKLIFLHILSSTAFS